MALNIIRGKTAAAIRGVIYGTEGIGKSTIASKIPDSLIIDTEDGSGQIDTARVVCLDWRAIEHAVKELIADTQGFRAVIIDTADWLEKALIEHMLKQAGKKSIEDYGFGKGYTILAEQVVRFLALCDQLVAKGVHVVFVAHAKVVRTSPPDQTDGFDRYELKLTKQVAPLFKEWADMVLFCQFRIQIVEGTDGRLKAQGGKERIMHAVHSAAWDAKNRYGLPEEMPMDFEKIAHLFTAAAPRSTAQVKAATVEAAIVADPTPKAKIQDGDVTQVIDRAEVAKIVAEAKKEPAKKPAPKTVEPERIPRATAEQIAEINAAKHIPAALDMIEDALAYCEALDVEELTEKVAADLILKLRDLNKPAAIFSTSAKEWLTANEEDANAYLIHVKWLKAGQTWLNLDQEQADSIGERLDKVKQAVGNHAKLNGRKAA